MAATSSSIVFDDIFTITAIDKDGKKFDRGTSVQCLRTQRCYADNCLLFVKPILVSRLFAHSLNYDMDLTLDYNIELYPLKQSEKFSLALASSLHRGGASGAGDVDGDDDKDQYIWRPDGKGRRGLEEDYEYVMYGKVSGIGRLCGGHTVSQALCEHRCTSSTGALQRLCTSLTLENAGASDFD
jgi:DNA-directed RNA polymerase I, II, and III subunit RPABC3